MDVKPIYQIDAKNLSLVVEEVLKELQENIKPKSELYYRGEDKMTQEEAAEYLDITPSTLISWKKKYKDLPYISHGRKFFYSKLLLNAFSLKRRNG